MNSRVTLGLAVVLLVGAIIAGYWGLTLSRQPTPEPVAVATASAPDPAAPAAAPVEDPTRHPVVVLVNNVPPFTPLTAADVTLEKLKTVPAGSLTSLDQAIGRTPWRALSAGTWLNDESFEAGSKLARMIRPGERALALAVDEVTGAGGQLTPGDYVDVLLYLHMDPLNPQPSAQLVVPALRVLGVGEQTGLTNDGQPSSPALSNEEKLKQDQLRATARTVVLAVPEELVSRLMLATQTGTLRLAVRSADEKRLARYWAGDNDSAATLANANRELLQFSQLAMSAPPKPAAVSNGAAPRKQSVEVIRGNQLAGESEQPQQNH
ncbi:Flp pilus assembly protein CpaB [Pseudomonas vancouverensis]|uniref:Flp pilus assembly protein CpaB n=1 Tax=Pseudomonas vancouverensis TaxID=95300 RepID=A0A1H2PA69_PSEVA|nr:Flp pilus assembly protein CpaB [Pseudomonas vancouverensis]KAB0491796.1 Flp pilus assembly protein CpaB [Pseudomonas vancouverensis]TDB61917.1 Flp pilus assembly protein CpaB [Pseudomonas vancouverensis]SDV14564.1 pilus assembly protein CpaB [Pseudomonas vancouverensis]